MKYVLFGFVCMSIFGAQAQDSLKLKAYELKVSSIDSTIETLYDVISGDQGVERDWELFKFLFRKNARLIPTGKNKE